jgi:spermidine/putrescine-binding protein
VNAAFAGLVRSASVFAGLLLVTFIVTGYFRRETGSRRVNLYIWSSYLAPDTLRTFSDRTGIRVEYDFYDSNETLFAKLMAGNVDYDVVVPSDYMVERLARGGLLAAIDRSRVPNARHVDPALTGLYFDPDGRYSLPFVPGTTAIGYRKDRVKKPVDSWAILWDREYANRIIMLDDMRENLGVALKLMGHSLNATDTRVLRAARDKLIEQKPLIKEYNSSNFQDLLITGDAWLAHGFNGQIARAAREYPFIGYSIPREGATRSLDNLCIPARAPHKEAAHRLIDFFLDPGVAAELCMYTSYTTANRAARAHLLPEVLENASIFPPQEALARCEYIRDVGPALPLYDRLWTEIKSR